MRRKGKEKKGEKGRGGWEGEEKVRKGEERGRWRREGEE